MYLQSMHVSYEVFLTAWLETWPMIERSIAVVIGNWIKFAIYFCPQKEKEKEKAWGSPIKAQELRALV
jgi:hypothetical protein